MSICWQIFNIMKNSLLLILTLLSLYMTGTAQVVNFEWAISIVDTTQNIGHDIAVDSSGNVYTTGTFQGTSDFDPSASTYNLSTMGGIDIFVQKLDSSGNLLWAAAMGGPSFDKGESIAIDASGNVYTTGSFSGTVDFDPGIGTYNLTSVGFLRNLFVQKLDASGNFIYAKSIGGASRGLSITTDLDGNVYTTGSFEEIVDFDPGAGTYNLTNTGSSDIFVQKWDASGNFIWAKAMTGTSSSSGFDITVDNLGNVHTTGVFQDTVDFDPSAATHSLISAGLSDIFIQKLDASGNFIYTKAIGGTNSDYGNSIAVDATGNVYTTGHFNDTVDFDPGTGSYNLTSLASAEVFILKLDASGNFTWAKSIEGTGYDAASSLALDDTEHIYLAGSFTGTLDFDPSLGIHNKTSLGATDAFILKLNSLGDFNWVQTFGGPSWDGVSSLVLNNIGDIYTTGSFEGIADFDPDISIFNLMAEGSGYDHDVFVQKLSQSLITSVRKINISPQIKAYPNPTYNLLNIKLDSPARMLKVELISIHSQILISKTATNSNHIELDISSESAGVYFVKITWEDNFEMIKVIKK